MSSILYCKTIWNVKNSTFFGNVLIYVMKYLKQVTFDCCYLSQNKVNIMFLIYLWKYERKKNLSKMSTKRKSWRIYKQFAIQLIFLSFSKLNNSWGADSPTCSDHKPNPTCPSNIMHITYINNASDKIKIKDIKERV